MNKLFPLSVVITSLFVFSCKKIVVIEATEISLSKEELVLYIGTTDTLEVTILPETTTDKWVDWISSDEKVARVFDGVVTAINAGAADIIAICGNVSDTCKLTVISAGVPGVSATEVTLSESSLNLFRDETKQLTATVSPSECTDVLQWSSSDVSVAMVTDGLVVAVGGGDAIITAKAGSKQATCPVSVTPYPKGAIDIGLVVGSGGTAYTLYWAECNLGAASREEPGDYYAWGEIETKDKYDWSTYKWGDGSGDNYHDPKLTKYNNDHDYGAVDNKLVLDIEDDAARAILGGSWRMPSREEITALINTQTNPNYTWTWKSINGNYGWEVIYLENSNSLFFPACGARGGTNIPTLSEDLDGNYWSSSIDSGWPIGGSEFWFNSGVVYPSSNRRCNGEQIRPVTD